MEDINVKKSFNSLSRNIDRNSIKETNDADAINFNLDDSNEELLQSAIETFSGLLFGDEIFTNKEAEIYVLGENAIEELLREAKDNRSIVEVLLNPNKYERDIRAEYEREHPEYAKVAKEGKKLQEEYNDARAATERIWLETNPEPQEKYQKGNGLFGFSQTEEYKKWHNEREQILNDFEKEYRYNNPDYDNLACAQAKNKSIIEIALESI